MQRRRFTSNTFDENIGAEKARLEAEAATLPRGPQKDGLLKKIRQLDTASHMSELAFIPPACSRRYERWRLKERNCSEFVLCGTGGQVDIHRA
jgi:hypothetical protein